MNDISKLCECGCGNYAKPGNRFINGHYIRINNPMKNPEIARKQGNTLTGVPKSEETKKNMMKFRSKKHRAAMSASKIGVPLSPEHKAAIKEGINQPDVIAAMSASKIGKNLGKDNNNWCGGVTPLYDLLRGCFKLVQWRIDVFTRDNYTCQECGKTGCYVEAHHKKPFSVILFENNIIIYEEGINCEELWDINNGVTLCEECHKKEQLLTMKQVKESKKK